MRPAGSRAAVPVASARRAAVSAMAPARLPVGRTTQKCGRQRSKGRLPREIGRARATAQICPPRRARAQSALGRRPCIAVRPTKAAGGCAASGTTTTDANARPCMAALAVLGPSRPRHAAACRHGLAALAEHAKTCIAIVANVRRSWRGALCAPLAVPSPTAHTRVRRVSSRPVQQPLSPSARRCGFTF